MNRAIIADALANHATDSATFEELKERFCECEYEYFNDLPLDELKALAVSVGFISEEIEIE